LSSWRESDFRERDRKSPRRWIGRGIGAWAVLCLLVLLNEQRRDSTRCDQDCFGIYRTYQPGHPWTNYTDSWQWDAQNILMTIAFLVSLAGVIFLLAQKRRRAVILTIVSIALTVIFVVWVQLSPPVGSD
jgi:lipoprotein signal peptidase